MERSTVFLTDFVPHASTPIKLTKTFGVLTDRSFALIAVQQAVEETNYIRTS